ncbi:MAG: hypothetical protein J7539_17795 [Niabella sp.]|nr:hypothetical protein [Niabella sp.]
MKKVITTGLFLLLLHIGKGQTNVFPADGNVGVGTVTPVLNAGLHIAKGDNSMIYFGPNASWGGSLYVGSGTNRIASGVAQVLSSNGNLHLDAGQNQHIYLGYFTSTPTYINPNGGNVGIGTTNPLSKLHIAGDDFLTIGDYSGSLGTKGILFTGFRDVRPDYFGASIEAVPEWRCCGGYPNNGYAGIKNLALNFNLHGDVNIADDRITAMSIRSSGNIGIGTLTPQEKLSVNGKIRAQEIKVEATNWPDYVFAPEHKLLPLEELSMQIKLQGHLPGIPTAKEVSAEGIALGEMNKKLLEKVEELTLYIIKQNDASRQQEEDVDLLKKQNIALLNRIRQLENKK